MEESLHSVVPDCKELLPTEIVNEELIVKNEEIEKKKFSELLKEEPYQDEIEAMVEESSVEGLKELIVKNEALKEEVFYESVKEEPFQDEFEAMVEESNVEGLSMNFDSQLLNSQVTSFNGLKNLEIISPEANIVIIMPCQNDVGMQAPPGHYPAIESKSLDGNVPHSGLLLEQASTVPSNTPNRKKTLDNGLLGGTLTRLSEKEKKEIFWCTTYARHPSFPKVGTTKRTRDIMLQRKIMPGIKVLQINDRRFTRIHDEVLQQKTSITKNQQLEIEKEVSQFIFQSSESHNTQETWNWDIKKNLFLMECYFIDQALPKKAETVEALSLALLRGDIRTNDLMVYLFQEKYKSPFSRNQIIQQRSNISRISKNPAAPQKNSHTFPTKAELEKLEETAFVKIQEMSFNHSFMEAVKDFNNKLFKCLDCNYKCNRKSDCRIHKLNHANIKQFRCSDCNYECNNKGPMKLHMLIHSNIKQFRCSDCDYECNRKSHLKQHMLIHSNIRQFKCSYCNYECNQKGNLKEHIMLCHFNIKQFKCPDCNYECSQKGSLNRHMLTHSNFKRFRCSDCEYESNQKRYLQQHMLLTHSKGLNIRRISCSKCDYECRRNFELKRHMLTHSSIKQFKCTECDFECNRKSNLKRHMLTHSNSNCHLP